MSTAYKRIVSHTFFRTLIKFTLAYAVLSIFAFLILASHNGFDPNHILEAISDFISSLAFLGKGPNHLPDDTELFLSIVIRITSYGLIALWLGLFGWAVFGGKDA